MAFDNVLMAFDNIISSQNSNLTNRFKTVIGDTTYNNMNLGNTISVRLYVPSGYAYHSLLAFSTNDWTVVFSAIHVVSNYVDVQCTKVVSGANNVTMSAGIVCIKV